MAWFQKVSLGDFAGAVNKLSESVKNIEKNFDTALGLEEKPADERNAEQEPAAQTSRSDEKSFFDPVMAFVGHKEDENATEVPELSLPEEHPSTAEDNHVASVEDLGASKADAVTFVEKDSQDKEEVKDSGPHISQVLPSEVTESHKESSEDTADDSSAEKDLPAVENIEFHEPVHEEKEDANDHGGSQQQAAEVKLANEDTVKESEVIVPPIPDSKHEISDSQEGDGMTGTEASRIGVKIQNAADATEKEQLRPEMDLTVAPSVEKYENNDEQSDDHISKSVSPEQDSISQHHSGSLSVDAHNEPATEEDNAEKEVKNQPSSTTTSSREAPALITSSSEAADSVLDIDKLKRDMKMMEAALQGAAKQAQSKADEIANLMNENEQLKSTIDDLKKKSVETEVDALRDEYHQRVTTLERKVYALTKERDTLRREQNKKSDAAALLKEKDEIITQVMAEGEELSKKQAAQEATIRKLRAQIREFEEEKQKLNSKLQVEETKVDSIKRDKAATEKLLQETIERNQAELAAQKEFYTNALNTAKEAEALAEARVNNEAKVELESRLREAGEKETMLLKTLEELRLSLTRKEQEAAFKEEMLKRDYDDLQKRYQASELRYNELVTQVPESTRPLLRQIEAMQETAARRAEAWVGVERSLNSRLQEAEAKAAAAEERERSLNERLSQSSSRITVLETQITILRTEQTQRSRSLEKERQRASESRQEYLAIKEEAASQEGRAKQLEDEIKELRTRHRKELQEVAEYRELLEKDLEREKAARAELEKLSSREAPKVANQEQTGSAPLRKLSSAGSINSMEESHFLQASLDTSENVLLERRISGESNMSYHLKSMTPSAFESALRQKDGELASYMSRLASLESVRNSLAEELVKMTEQCEKLRTEASALPGIRAELEALRQRHSQALELMGERDEELEELRNDIVDLKEMYREQVDLLVSQVQMLGSKA